MSQSSQDHPTSGFLTHFDGVEGPRQQAKVTCPLNEILLLVLCAVISGSGGWTSIAPYGDRKLEFRAAFCRSGTERHAMISWGSCFPVWIWRPPNAVS